MAEKTEQRRRIGVWLVGVLGGVATTAIVGAIALGRKLCPPIGLATTEGPLAKLPLVGLEDIVFGGHDVRTGSLLESARAIAAESGGIPTQLIDAVADQLDSSARNIRVGVGRGAGRTIEKLACPESLQTGVSIRDAISRISGDLRHFAAEHRLDDVVVVNVASTEPPIETGEDHRTIEGFERLIAVDAWSRIRPSSIYAWAAIDCGYPWINFTPSNAALLDAHVAFAQSRRVPVMGSDGKTGETLVKTALAPMFRYRNLKVLTWHGYNMLGDRDGQVLADEANRSSKISTKATVLDSILGYSPATHVEINFAESLNDLKTAWNFIHFAGFMGFKMNLQFTWQGCDSVLAAPLVLDLVRLAEFAHRRGEHGLMPQAACFFKRPAGLRDDNLHRQFELLERYAMERSSS